MPRRNGKSSRRDDILQALAAMLESSTGARITTAALARQVGFSEAALYKHFPSKATMYEGLLDFVDEALFGAVNTIAREQTSAARACGDILLATLKFAELNPGITRLICGDALHGEDPRLQSRAANLLGRLTSELKQVIRRGEVQEQLQTALPPGKAAMLMSSVVEGRLHQFVRTGFTDKPTAEWALYWEFIERNLFGWPAGRQD